MATTESQSNILTDLESKKRCRLYNIYNKDNKENENNRLIDNQLSPSSSGIGANAPLINPEVVSCQKEEAEPSDSSPVNQAPTPMLDEDMIKTAVMQFFDNGEQASQRHKLKIRINLVDGEDVEFIASLTKDARNFKKFIPAECKEIVTAEAMAIRKQIKKTKDVYPYIGKFHFNTHKKHVHAQTEPFTWVAIWWDAEYKGWSGILRIYDWYHEFDLFAEFITEKQKKSGVKAQTTYSNPKNDTRVRAKTWAERRMEK